jgi:hypothetical protein
VECEVVSTEEVYLDLSVPPGVIRESLTWNDNGRYFVVEPIVRCDVLAIGYFRQIEGLQAQIRDAKQFHEVSKRVFLEIRLHLLLVLREV